MEYSENEDLPFIPCYEGTNCKSVYNCGGISGDWSCDGTTTTSGLKTCPDGTQEGWCWGNDPNFCSGIYTECPEQEGLKCGSKINPVENILGDTAGVNNQWMGCDVLTDPNCFEFTRDSCSENCWEFGGREEVNVLCQNFKDIQSCNSMDFFCDWNAKTNTCEALLKNPFEVYYNKNGHNPDNAEYIEISEKNDKNWYVTCARSGYDSEHMTSYASDARTCCLHKPELGKKYCISNPRCEFVQNTCDCGMKDIGLSYPHYMCTASYGTAGVGYCTWCKGQQQDFTPNPPTGYQMKESIEWLDSNGNCDNRCTNFNECEVDNSELLWNQCVYEKSGGIVGLSPQQIAEDPSLVKTFGFCIPSCENNDTECQTERSNMQNLAQECENELRPQVRSRNTNQIYDPTTGPWEACKYNNRWEHICLQDPYTGKKTTMNFACSWCPSLQDFDDKCEAPERASEELPIAAIVGGTVGGISAVGMIITAIVLL